MHIATGNGFFMLSAKVANAEIAEEGILLTFQTDVQRVHSPAKNANERLSSKVNQTGDLEPSGRTSFSEKDEKGTTQRLSTPSHLRQCGDETLRMLVSS
jgi:hypothetical protein